VVGFAIGAGSGLLSLAAIEEKFFVTVGVIVALLAGVAIFALGILIAALGEGLLALKDIAVSTWLAAERRE